MNISGECYAKALKLFYEVIDAGAAINARIPLLKYESIERILVSDHEVYVSRAAYKELLAGLELIAVFAPAASELLKEIQQDTEERNNINHDE